MAKYADTTRAMGLSLFLARSRSSFPRTLAYLPFIVAVQCYKPASVSLSSRTLNEIRCANRSNVSALTIHSPIFSRTVVRGLIERFFFSVGFGGPPICVGNHDIVNNIIGVRIRFCPLCIQREWATIDDSPVLVACFHRTESRKSEMVNGQAGQYLCFVRIEN